jgi:hypothetical protein
MPRASEAGAATGLPDEFIAARRSGQAAGLQGLDAAGIEASIGSASAIS